MKKFIATTIIEFLNENAEDNFGILLYHATNSTWTKPEMSGLGFHGGTLKAAKDRMKSFRVNINPHIKMFKFYLKNPLYVGRDYRFHDNLTKVSNELFKDKIISKEERDTFIRIYDDGATFENLRKLLHDKYGYDGIIYRNNIEDRGSNSYIAFFPHQVEFVGIYDELKEQVKNNNSFYIYHGTGKGQAKNIQKDGYMKPNNTGEEQPSISFTNDLDYAKYYAKSKGGVSKMCILRTKLSDDYKLSPRIVNNKGDEYITFKNVPSSYLEVMTMGGDWKPLDTWNVIFDEPLDI